MAFKFTINLNNWVWIEKVIERQREWIIWFDTNKTHTPHNSYTLFSYHIMFNWYTYSDKITFNLQNTHIYTFNSFASIIVIMIYFL